MRPGHVDPSPNPLPQDMPSGRPEAGPVGEGAIRDGQHHFPLRVYYEDTDAGGVVYHANYLRFAERARTEALRVMGIPHAELVERHGMMFMVRRAEVDYVRPARPDDSLVIETETLAIGGASLSLRQTV